MVFNIPFSIFFCIHIWLEICNILGAWVLILLSVKSEDCWIIDVQGNCGKVPDGCIGLSVIPVDCDFSIDKS